MFWLLGSTNHKAQLAAWSCCIVIAWMFQCSGKPEKNLKCLSLIFYCITVVFQFKQISWLNRTCFKSKNYCTTYDLFQNTIHDVYNTTINDLYNEISTSYSTLISDVVRTKINIISFLVQLNNIINFNRAPCLVLVSCIQIMLQNIKAHGVTW